jgi:RNA polymerase sigma factor (sigma-70 family)
VVNKRAWLRAVLFRLFVDERRRMTKERCSDNRILDQVEDTREPPASWTSLTIEDVQSTLPLLPRRYREPYDLFAFHQLSYRDIAARLGLSVRTVGTRITRARRKLRRLLRATYDKERGLSAQSVWTTVGGGAG